MPDDPYERAQVLQWMFFEQYDHEPAIAVVRFLLAFSGRPEEFADRRAERTAAGYGALDAMERHLGRARVPRRRRHYARRHRALRVHARGATRAVSTSRYPAIRAWLERVAATPGTSRSTAEFRQVSDDRADVARRLPVDESLLFCHRAVSHL